MLVHDPSEARADLSEGRKPSFGVALGARAEQNLQATSKGNCMSETDAA
jgi:hypothetical protein